MLITNVLGHPGKASKMNAAADLAAGILLLTSLISVFTITLGVYLFKASGLI
jgi:predicted permease